LKNVEQNFCFWKWLRCKKIGEAGARFSEVRPS
jgi:hypothetical protein